MRLVVCRAQHAHRGEKGDALPACAIEAPEQKDRFSRYRLDPPIGNGDAGALSERERNGFP